MKQHWSSLIPPAALAVLLAACASSRHTAPKPEAAAGRALSNVLQTVKARHVPDHHLALFNVGGQPLGRSVALTGEVDSVSAKTDALAAVAAAGFQVVDRITVLPAAELGDVTWGLACLSVANAREKPDHKAEMGMQVLMGHPFRVLKGATNWFLVQTPDRYLSWMEKGAFVRCTQAEVDAWNNAPLVIVTAFEERVLEQPHPDAAAVTDVVTGCKLKQTGAHGDWFKVELPDHRDGYLPKGAAEDYATWKATRRPTPDNIERAARQFLGRPYLWGGNSPKGLDCSGFTKLVFFLNGIELDRNASHQCKQGVAVPLDPELSQLRKGDLVFFGFRATPDRPERITHTGIYLGDKLFIHSSERVRINSLDPDSPMRDAKRIRMLLHARRVLPAL